MRRLPSFNVPVRQDGWNPNDQLGLGLAPFLVKHGDGPRVVKGFVSSCIRGMLWESTRDEQGFPSGEQGTIWVITTVQQLMYLGFHAQENVGSNAYAMHLEQNARLARSRDNPPSRPGGPVAYIYWVRNQRRKGWGEV